MPVQYVCPLTKKTKGFMATLSPSKAATCLVVWEGYLPSIYSYVYIMGMNFNAEPLCEWLVGVTPRPDDVFHRVPNQSSHPYADHTNWSNPSRTLPWLRQPFIPIQLPAKRGLLHKAGRASLEDPAHSAARGENASKEYVYEAMKNETGWWTSHSI